MEATTQGNVSEKGRQTRSFATPLLHGRAIDLEGQNRGRPVVVKDSSLGDRFAAHGPSSWRHERVGVGAAEVVVIRRTVNQQPTDEHCTRCIVIGHGGNGNVVTNRF
jgi:hypothetical protein